ncbi:MAG: Twin-arginine translocation protein TatC [Myxococcales bacterium]|nr:Twin-arginine translocation protein TatC [Myxococcales bacterium]
MSTAEQETPPEPANSEDARMSFVEHLSELRLRLRNAAVIFLVVMMVSFVFVKKYFSVLTLPAVHAWTVALHGTTPTFHFASPTEPFWVYTKLAMYCALLVSSPLIFWELWKFIAPGLYRKEKRMALTITVATAVCFIGGALFGYFVISTPALTYMLSFAEQMDGYTIQPTIMMDEVVGFMSAMLLGTGIAFELPVLLGVLGWLGIIKSRQLWKFNRYALILSTVVGGVLTPGPDVLSQVLMAGPLFGLYNVSILIVFLIERGNRERLEKLAKETGADLVPVDETEDDKKK